MDNSEILKRLLTAKTAIEKAIDALQARTPEGDLPTCSYCGLEIQPGSKLKRQVHDACYQEAWARVQSGETTWEELEREGEVGMKGASGRTKDTPRSRAVRQAEVGLEKFAHRKNN